MIENKVGIAVDMHVKSEPQNLDITTQVRLMATYTAEIVDETIYNSAIDGKNDRALVREALINAWPKACEEVFQGPLTPNDAILPSEDLCLTLKTIANQELASVGIQLIELKRDGWVLPETERMQIEKACKGEPIVDAIMQDGPGMRYEPK